MEAMPCDAVLYRKFQAFSRDGNLWNAIGDECNVRVNDIPKQAAGNPVIFDSYVKAQSVLKQHENPVCSISGGSDSDVMLDMMVRLDEDKRIQYVWFNTGLEYKATKEHLDYLEKEYHIEILRIAAVKSVPVCVNTYGVPFVSKRVSDEMERLQRHGFKWEDEPYEILAERYPKCLCSIKWWCNKYEVVSGKTSSMWNINRNTWLKEFLTEHPPEFNISKKCCDYAKKATAKKVQKQGDLNIQGVRKSEGGVRAVSYKNCYSVGGKQDSYRPLFWYSDEDKREYKELFGLRHSDCYEVWGFKRTGCVGCPYSNNIAEELEIINQYEPNMYKACMKIFGESYRYKQQYKDFQKKCKDDVDACK